MTTTLPVENTAVIMRGTDCKARFSQAISISRTAKFKKFFVLYILDFDVYLVFSSSLPFATRRLLFLFFGLEK